MTQKITLEIKRTFDAPLEKVWKAWTTVEGLKKWFGPDHATVVKCTSDFIVGGKYSISMNVRESIHTVGGQFTEIKPMEKFSCTFLWAFENSREMLVTVKLRETDGKTQMHFYQEGFPDEESKNMHKGGWSGSFKKLEKECA